MEVLYKAIFALGYYGLLRVGELTDSPHVIKARDVHLALNKEKILVVLQTSKTHGRNARPQKVKITANSIEKMGNYMHRNFCPFRLLNDYIGLRGDYCRPDDRFFVFLDGSPVSADKARKVLKLVIDRVGLNCKNYDMHSLRIGRASDLIKYGYSVEDVKRIGHWKSNAIYRYLKKLNLDRVDTAHFKWRSMWIFKNINSKHVFDHGWCCMSLLRCCYFRAIISSCTCVHGAYISMLTLLAAKYFIDSTFILDQLEGWNEI